MMPAAAIVGLGQVAWKFDEEPGRKTIWTHLGAYKSTGRFGSIIAYDSDAAACRSFAERHPDVTLVPSLETLVAQRCDAISICTPPDTHRSVLEAVLLGAPKVIWCEKPLATSLADATWMVGACAERDIPLIVSHVRRWHRRWRRFRERIATGDIGTVRCLRIAMPNRLWSIGSHGIDLLLWIGGPIAEMRALELPAAAQGGEPACAALLRFASGVLGIFQVTGLKEKFVVEAEAIGDRGRLVLSESRGTVRLERFERSKRYEGYEELAEAFDDAVPGGHDDSASPFSAIAMEVLALLAEPHRAPTCSGRDALETQRALAKMAAGGRASMTGERGIIA